MGSFLRLDPPIPLKTVKGNALAHFLIDYSIEHDLFWVCFMDETGECWTFNNKDIRAQKNITLGRDYISPFYNPDDVKLAFKEEDYTSISPLPSSFNQAKWLGIPDAHKKNRTTRRRSPKGTINKPIGDV